MAETTVKTNELREEFRQAGLAMLGLDNVPGIQTIAGGWAFPIKEDGDFILNEEGKPVCMKVQVSVCNWRNTEKTIAFDLKKAHEAYTAEVEATIAEKAAKAAAKAAKKK